MYELNTFLRLARFLANAILGIAIGFVLGYVVAKYGINLELIEKFI